MLIRDNVTGDVLGTPVLVSYSLFLSSGKQDKGFCMAYIPPLYTIKDFVKWKKSLDIQISKKLSVQKVIIDNIVDMSSYFANSVAYKNIQTQYSSEEDIFDDDFTLQFKNK